MIPQPSNERPTITGTAKRNESLLPAGAALRAAASQANTCLVLFTPGGELKTIYVRMYHQMRPVHGSSKANVRYRVTLAEA